MGQNWPMMYTRIIKIAIDVAKTSHTTSLQVLWLISYLISYEIYLLLMFFFDKAYDLSTYPIKIDWLNNNKSW